MVGLLSPNFFPVLFLLSPSPPPPTAPPALYGLTFWDIFILALALALLVEGLWKGAVRLGFGLAGLLAGYLYAGYIANHVATYLTFLVEHLRRPVAVAAGFLVVFTVFVLAGAIVHRLVKSAGLGLVNRVLGATLGVVAAVYIAGGLVHLSGRLSPDYPAKLTRGPVMRLMSDWAVGIEALIPSLPVRPEKATPHKNPPAGEVQPENAPEQKGKGAPP